MPTSSSHARFLQTSTVSHTHQSHHGLTDRLEAELSICLSVLQPLDLSLVAERIQCQPDGQTDRRDELARILLTMS